LVGAREYRTQFVASRIFHPRDGGGGGRCAIWPAGRFRGLLVGAAPRWLQTSGRRRVFLSDTVATAKKTAWITARQKMAVVYGRSLETPRVSRY